MAARTLKVVRHFADGTEAVIFETSLNPGEDGELDATYRVLDDSPESPDYKPAKANTKGAVKDLVLTLTQDPKAVEPEPEADEK